MVKRCVVMCIFLGLSWIVSVIEPRPIVGIRWNPSPSLPYSLFLSFKIVPGDLKRDAIISFRLPQSKVRLAKRIAGLPQDVIRVVDHTVYVNETCIGPVQTQSPSGQLLTPIQEGPIPGQHVFVYGGHPHSFDSRYSQFGLIPEQDIEELLWPIF